jgi:tetratricopeptide (TPR) repeat protein
MIHTIITLNNRGVAHLEAGDHELARIAFKQALERTTYLLNLKREARDYYWSQQTSVPAAISSPANSVFSSQQQQQQQQRQRRNHQQHEQQQHLPHQHLQQHQSYHQPQHSQQQHRQENRPNIHQAQQSHGQQEQPNHQFNAIQRVRISSSLTSRDIGSFISAHAILLSNDCCTNPLDQSYCHRESACVMFNLALVHHWRGMQFGLSSLLPKALRLYEMSFSLIQCGTATFDTQHMVLALLNNMGQIHHELLQYKNARQCFKNLKEILTIRATSASDSPDVQGFLLNIMFLEAPQLAPAA